MPTTQATGGPSAAEAPPPLFPGTRLHVVTGKGGTGKSTVAASLALALAHGGRKVLLVEVENRQGVAQLFDVPPLPYEERKVAVAPGGGDVFALAIDPEAALLDYLQMFYRLSPTGIPARTLRRMGAIDFATTIAPGLRDVLLTGKVKEAVVRTASGGRPVYDAVVLDAPPTGRVVRFLTISDEIGGLAKVGPLKSQSDSVMAVLRSPQTRVHLVTLLEEMPVQETADGVDELTAADLLVGAVVVNGVRARHLPDLPRAGGVPAGALTTALRAAGLPADRATVAGLRREAADHLARRGLEDDGRAVLADLAPPVVELPLLPDAVDLGGLYALADRLRVQGLS